MRKQNLQNSEFDRIGRDLFKASKPSAEEVEKLVAAPHLFDSVKARIKVDEQARRKADGFIDARASLWLWNRRAAATAFSLIFLAGCAALMVFRTSDSSPLIKQVIEPVTNVPSTENEKLFSLQEANEKKPAVERRIKSDRIVSKPEKSITARRARKLNSAKAPQRAEKSSPEVFYSLASAGRWEATGDDLQIVRAELSRAELSALGVNLPVENETGKIKTDLLVGSDGTAKAIRFVEKF